jgi:hypothetical protein
MLALGLLAAGAVDARDAAFGGARFAVPAGYERGGHDDPEAALFALETVAAQQCTFTVSSGYAPTDTLVREFAVVWRESIDDTGTIPEPRRAANAAAARYVAGEGRMRVDEGTRGLWNLLAIVDFEERQRHLVLMTAHAERDIPRCRKDADALLASLRAEPGWVPPPVEEPATEPSVEDLTLLNGKATAVELLWCESKKKQRQRCPADTSAGVVFVGRTSFAECEDGKSYWVDDDAIVVDKGCRARFAVRAADGSDGRGERFACESFLKDSIYCDLYRIDRGVRIGRVLSRAPCVWNESWGVLLDDLGINSYVWVANGCRAEFHRW